jgi:hypothetical protein
MPFQGLSCLENFGENKIKSSPERAEDQRDGCSPSTFDSGYQGMLTIHGDLGKQVIADAVKFEFVQP